MKKKHLIIFVIILACSLFFQNHAVAESQKSMVLQYELWLPTKMASFPVIQEFYKGLEEATGGAVKVRFHTGGSMGKAGETYQRTLSGVNDIGHINPIFNSGVFPMWDIFDYPVRCPSGEQLARLQIKMYEKGYFDKEFSQVKVMALYNVGSFVLYSNKKITKFDELKGIKIRISSMAGSEMAKAVDAVPVSTGTGEIYLAMQKGIVDVVMTVWDGAVVFKLNEVSKYVNEINLMSTTHIVLMNKKTWEKLPQAGKDYIDANWKTFSLKYARAHEARIPRYKKMFLGTGDDREIIEFAPGESEKMDKRFTPIWQKWIADREEKGLPAKKAIDELYKMMIEEGIKDPIAGYNP